MPRIKREPKDSLLNSKLGRNLTKYILNYLSYKEIYEIGKSNLFLMNNVIDYFEETEPYPEKLRKLKSIYNFKIYQGEVDQTLKEAKINKRRYKYSSENKVNYYQFDIDGNQYLSIARTFGWAHKDNPEHWEEKKVLNSYEKEGMVPYLISVCWIDAHFSFFHVKPNNYQLYINELFITEKRFKERVIIKVSIEDKIIYEKKFPSEQIFNNNNNQLSVNVSLKEDFICLIKKEDFDSIIAEKKLDANGRCKITVSFWHVDDFWKSGWLIDGGSLKEITQQEMEKYLEEMKIKNEEEERKKFFESENNRNTDDMNEQFPYRMDDNDLV